MKSKPIPPRVRLPRTPVLRSLASKLCCAPLDATFLYMLQGLCDDVWVDPWLVDLGVTPDGRLVEIDLYGNAELDLCDVADVVADIEGLCYSGIIEAAELGWLLRRIDTLPVAKGVLSLRRHKAR